LLKGVGAKRAEAIANCLCDLEVGGGGEEGIVESLGQLGRIKGVGGRLVENMRLGMAV
jgi:DNA uptake protein ComE-like DNA-binding protein